MSKGYLGESIPKLGFGFMRLPMIGKEMDMERTCKMVDAYMAKGFTYFDTAYVYHEGTAEGKLKEALVDRYPRESFQLTSKLPFWETKNAEDMKRIFHESMQNLGVEYIDFYLLHALDKGKMELAEKYGAWEFLLEMKAKGYIKHLGFSFHDSAEVLEEALTKYKGMAEFVQLQINYIDWESDNVQSRKCYEVALKHNMPIIIMEPIKGGTLANIPQKAEDIFKKVNPEMSVSSWAIRYCASLENIVTVLSGMSTEEQVEDNTSYMEHFEPLSKEEQKVVEEVVEVIKSVDTVPCTSCKYCVPDCPMDIHINDLFNVYNNNKMFGREGEKPINVMGYKNNTNGAGKASECIACGSCESHCPQHISIIDRLSEIADLYEPYL